MPPGVIGSARLRGRVRLEVSLPLGHICMCCLQKARGGMVREILTTHVGRLPRGEELVPLLLARDHGEPYDAAALEQLVQAAVADAVAKQEAAGVSIVSDGELGKIGYSTYIKDRLGGFGGGVPRQPAPALGAPPA